MNEPPRCPKCGIQLPADAPAGLCPKCLVQAGFESQPASQPGPTVLTPPNSGFAPPTVEELAPLFPQLEILELLGKGGMGAVYKARQPGLDRLVAVKILPPEISHDPAFAERFQREARALARLSHPHIVAVYDFGQTKNNEASGGRQPAGSANRQLDQGADAPRSPIEESLCYIVMEFVDGANLRQTMRTGTLTSAEALAIVPQICEALQFAHDEGIVHRDIKPENILIDKRGRVKIADFGLAKLLGQDASDHSLTATHQVMGTLRYMAPEQMQGSREVDHRADIYSLGVVFYELLTGELPMGKFAPPSKKVQVDVRLDEIVLRALEQDPEQRYQHASEVKSDVETISRSPSVARPEFAKGVDGPSDARATPPAEPHVFSGQTYFVVVLTVLALVGLAMWFGQSAWWLLALFVPETMIAALTRPDELRTLGSRLRLLTVVLAILGLIAFGMWLEQSPWPLLALVIFSVPIVAASVKEEDETPGNETTGTAPVSSPATESVARPESAKGTATETQLVQAPADCLLLAAGIAFVTACGVALWLGVSASLGRNITNLTNPMIRGNLTGMSVGLAIYSVFVALAGLLLRRLRVRLFVLLVAVIVGLFFPAVCALNVVMELRNIPVWPVVIPLWLGMPAALWVVVTLFRDDVRRAFDAAAKQRAEKMGTDPVSLPPAAPPPKRPKLVPVLATFNLLGAIVLMLVSAMEQPAAFAESVPRLWQVWEKVDCVLGFVTAAGLFAASIGLFLWKPWARKLTLGVCVFSLATFVFDAPYLARFVLPDFYAEVQLMLAVEAVDPDLLDLIALGTVVGVMVIPMLVALACLIGQLVYFTRPRVVAAFESPNEKPSKFVDWLFTGTGAVLGALSVFGPLALLLGIAALFEGAGKVQTTNSSASPGGGRADSQTGELWFGNDGNAHLHYSWPSSPVVSDRLAGHLGLDASQREAMNQAFQRFFREFQTLEEQNTRRETDAQGHQITTISAFPQPLTQLEVRFWSELETALDGRQLTLGRKTVRLREGIFASWDYDYRIEIWRVGQVNPWYHWKESYPGRPNFTPSSEIDSSSGPELPEKFRRFWKEPTTTNTDTATLNDRRLLEEGTWKLVRLVYPAPDAELESKQERFVVFKDNKLIWFDKSPDEQGRLEEDFVVVDASRTPKRFEAVAYGAQPGVPPTKWLGVYDLQDDTLKLYYGPDERWLKSFETELQRVGPKAASAYIELKRVQPPEKIE